MKTIFTYSLLLNFLLTGLYVSAQETKFSNANAPADTNHLVRIAKEYIDAHLSEWRLTSSDIAEMTISDMHTDRSSGISRIYFLQRYKGIPVFNAILNVNITKTGKVFFATNRFVQGLEDKINTTVPVLNAGEAVSKFASQLGLPSISFPMKTRNGNLQYVFDKADVAREDIPVELNFQPVEDRLLLAWDILLAPISSYDSWSVRIDAVTGEVLTRNNWSLYCKVDEDAFSREVSDCEEPFSYTQADINPIFPSDSLRDDPGTGPLYNVWPAPVESPAHGPRTIVTNPADEIASPFGWHDINGQPGSEFTITRGNNVYAYQDRYNTGVSSGDEPDGGADLQFDFPFDPSWEPDQYTEAAVVNLFYWVNYLHDFSYHFGFDEASGNFQKNNYGHGGEGNDFIWAVTQSAAATDSLHNNSVYFNRNEGTSSSIYMADFIPQSKYLIVNEPAGIAGKYFTNIAGPGWNSEAYVSDVPVTGEVVIVNDGVDEPSTADACQDILNASELAGKIVMIDRGACQFSFKALQAQNAGAIGVIICSPDNKTYTMAAGPDAPNVHIPIVSVPVKECNILRQYAGRGLKVTLVNPGQIGPERLDSDLEGALIAHEFGHGISIRLAGGPDKACLDNSEQMGEGWSDFFALVTTVRSRDTGNMRRGLGTYIMRESIHDNGIRRYPYSTDMNISPLTYGDVAANQEKHDLGEVWANMLWDMYWAMVDEYGWNGNPYDETGGNYKAIRLVVDGLKNMACDPGFVDGRNAILAADEALYNGENSCLLWKVFARRGLGYSADQGSPYDAGDQKEAFDLPPVCSGKIIIEKSVTDFIQPGENIDVTIKVGNYKNETVTNVVVTDIIPEGTSLKPNSANYAVIKQGNKLYFDLGNMISNKEKTITYTLTTLPNAWSQRRFIDEVHDENDAYWISHTIGSAASNNWFITDTLSAHPGNYVWISPEIPEKSQQVLMLNPDTYVYHVEGVHPTMRFYHRYQTLAGINGGVVEVREVGTSLWQEVSQSMIRNGYTGALDYRTFLSPNVKAFSGNSGDEFQATYVDLSPWTGLDIQVRFRFGTYINTHDGAGWCIDDIEFMDLLAYNEEVCVSTHQDDQECAIAPGNGTIVESREEPLSATTTLANELRSRIYPNPASDHIIVAMSTEHPEDVNVSLLTLDGRQLFSKSLTVFGNDNLNIHTSAYPSGIYIVKVNTPISQYVERVIVQNL